MRRLSMVVGFGASVLLAATASATQPTVENALPVQETGAAAHGAGTAPGAERAGHGTAGGEMPAAHGDAHDTHAEGAHDAHINWAEGFVGESNEEPPGLMWRPVGTPPPLLANFINSALLFFILYKVGKAPLAEGLRKRKARIVAGMNEAAKMRREAEESLEGYEEKLRHVDEEIERVRREMREASEAERKRILEEAKERRARMERDARMLVEQEMKAARDLLMRETIRAAVASAEELLKKQVTPQDQERLASEYVETLASTSINATGGDA